MSEDDRIRRAAALPPPTLAEAILLPVVTELVATGLLDIDSVCARAKDKAAIANVLALHGASDSESWKAAFLAAEIRLDSVAAMIRADVPAKPPKAGKKPKKRKKR